MKYFFIVVDYLIPVLMIVSVSWWKKIANGEISKTSGFRTNRSMKNKDNWNKANLLAGKYSFIFGIILFLFTFIMRRLQLVQMEWNSLIVVTMQIISMFMIVFIVNKKIARL